MSISTNTQKLNTIYQKYNLQQPVFKFRECSKKFICHFELPNGTTVCGEPMPNKKLAKESVASIALQDIGKIASYTPVQVKPVVFSGLIIVDGDNITKSDQIELLAEMEALGANIIIVVASTYDISRIAGKLKKIYIIENVGKQCVDIWIIGYIVKYNFCYGSEIVIISIDHFATTLANMAHIFHSRPINISVYNSVTALCLSVKVNDKF